MPIRYRCPSCQQLLGISSRMAGQEMPCPTCGRVTVVPTADDDQPIAGSAFEPPPDEPVPSHPVAERGGAAEGGRGHREAPLPSSMPASDEVETNGSGDSPFEPDAGGFQVHSRKVDSDEMDLTPMVDMTFLLLIFFMITASFSVQKSIAFPPPSPDQKGASQTMHTLEEFENNSIIVRIDHRNVIHVDDDPLNDPARVVDVFRAALSTRRNEVVVMADDEALHETVVAVIDAANAAGMQKIRLATRGSE